MADARATISVEQFIRYASSETPAPSSAGTPQELRGWIAWDGELPDVVLYTPYPVTCPHTPIPKDRIEGINIGNTSKCWGKLGQMWDATIYLKPAVSAEAQVFERLLTAVLAASRSRP